MSNNNNRQDIILTVVLAFVLSLVVSIDATAQRTMKGQHAIGIDVSGRIPNLADIGICLNYSQYLLNAYWQVGAFVGNNQIKTDNGLNLEYIDSALCGGYMHRLIATKSRSICLYAGGGAFIGYEFYDPRKDLPANIDTKLPTGNFLYGIFPSIEAAFFVTRQLALTVSSVAMINFSSPLVKLRPQIRMGLKIDI